VTMVLDRAIVTARDAATMANLHFMISALRFKPEYSFIETARLRT